MLSSLRSTLAVACILVAAGEAAAGRLQPALENKLRAAAPDAAFSVIVEMKDQSHPGAIVAGVPKAARKARLKALVAGLRERAERGQGALKAELARQRSAGAVRRMRAFWIFNGFAVTADAPAIRSLAERDDVLEVRLDQPIPLPPRPASTQTEAPAAEWNITLIRAPEVWALDPAYNGAGMVVGSFDTGVDASHEALAGNYRGNHAVSWFDPYGEHAAPYDPHGHGTHTTGTAVGGNAGGTHIGVAPGAQWIAAKAWADSGAGFTSEFHEIFEWFLAPGGDPENAPDVVINSWALTFAGCIREFAADIQAWRAAGIFPAFAAGNSGPGTGTVRSPGAYPESFAVGATDAFDEVASFSSRGPSACDGAIKPDISAPGAGVRSAVPGGYETWSGTSMATPHLAGAVAVLRAVNPALTVDDLTDVLKLGAADIITPGADNASGAGRLDLFVSAEIAIRGMTTPIVRAVATQPVATEAGPAAGTLAFTRTGNTDAALEVKFEVSGTAVPGSDYAALPDTIVLPAGAASATLAVTPIDDALLEANESVSITVVPDPAYIASSARVATVMIVSDELFPDLAASSLSAPATAGPGQSITVGDTTTNHGAGPADASTTDYFLSSDNVLDAADAKVGSRAVPALAVGAASAGSAVAAIPAGTATGTWRLIAVADAGNAVPEDKETNNSVSRLILIGPDLAVAALSAPAVTGAGATILVGDTTENQGAGPAGASRTDYFFSANSAFDTGDALLGSRVVAPLSGGATDSGAATVVVPATAATGTWYIIARADSAGAVTETSETDNIRTRSIRIGPDLDVTAFSAASVGGAGDHLTITDTTHNQGGATAPESVTQFYLSTNATLDGADLALGSRTVAALAPETGDTASTSVALPAALTSGTWYLIARADGPGVMQETSETNNLGSRSIKVGPDLRISAASVPDAAGAGDSVTVTDTTKNQGGGAASASTTSYYFSADADLDAADTLIGSRSVPALPGGASSSASTVLIVPPGAATASWQLIVVADSTAAIDETVETNNDIPQSIAIGPDLRISTLTVPAAGGAGLPFSIGDTTRNQGGGTSAASSTAFFLSADTTLDANDVPLGGGRQIPGLAAGASNAGSTPVVLPPDTQAGAWYIVAKADVAGAVAETSESNNVTSKAFKIGADLTVSALGAPSATAAGRGIAVTETTKNLGGAWAQASQTQYFVSTDSAFDATDAHLGTRSVPALAAGASSSASVQLTLPDEMAAGKWYLLAVADREDAVVESNEANNGTQRLINVGPDLSVAGLSAPASAVAGQRVTVTETTRNLGAADAPASRTQFFLSTNSSLDGADTPLTEREVAALAAGASSVGSTEVSIPAGTPAGRWYLIGKADGAGAVAESVETNNTTARILDVSPP